MKKDKKKNKDTCYCMHNSIGHPVYIVEARTKEEDLELRDKYGTPLITNEWSKAPTEEQKRPNMKATYPSGGDIFTPKDADVLTYEQAMCLAWGLKAEKGNVLEVRVRRLSMDYKYEINYLDEEKSVHLIKEQI